MKNWTRGALIAGLLLGTGWWLKRDAGLPKTEPEVPETSTQVRSSSHSASAMTPAPPPTPIASEAARFDALAARARAGELHASRQLYTEVRACQWLQHSEESLRELQEVANRDGVSKLEAEAAQQQLQAATRMQCLARARCNGLKPQQLADPLQWLLLAAQQGDLEAQIGFVAGTYIHGGDLGSLDHLGDYQRLAPAMLERALAAGHPAAYVLAARALVLPDDSPQQDLLAELLPADPQRARVYSLALARASGDPEYPATVELIDELYATSPQQRVETESAANRLYLEYFSKLQDLDRMLRDFAEQMSDPSTMPANAKLLAETEVCR